MRGDSFPEKKLKGDCSNLSGVLFLLWEKAEMRSIILDFIKSLPEQDISDIEFFEDRRGKISLELIETFGDKERKWSVELLSDGTLRVLAIAAALLSAPEGATVVIEEVDNGVHPSRAKQLLKTMREQASQRNIRLLFSTHNPALMDALPDEALSDVVFCYRDPIQGDSRLIRLADIQDYPGLVSQGPLGDLVTNGVLDRFIKSPVTSEQKKKAAFNGEAPWKTSEFPKSREIMNWIDSFPDLAGQNKSVTKTGEGTSFADLSIIQDYKKCIKKFSMAEIFIWSLDSDLKFYHHRPHPRP